VEGGEGMKVKKKCVYYCDYCSKKSLRSLKIHEKHCTTNPNRECRLCGNKSIKPIIEKYQRFFYLKKIKKHLFGDSDFGKVATIIPVFKKKFTLKELINEFDYICPNCILAIIRCLGLNRYYMKDKFKFDYKKALDNWWRITNEQAYKEAEREMYY